VWVARYLDAAGRTADAVIHESSMQYFAPVRGTLRASLCPPAAPLVEKFEKMLQRAGRGRIRLQVDIHQGSVLAAHFDGVYAAAVR
jgi:thioesterase domain-containing protein